MTLDDAANIALIVQTGAIIGGLAFALTQLRQGRTTRNLETISLIFDGIHDRGSYEARRRLAEFADRDMASLGSEEHLDASTTTDLFQRLGFLASNGFIDKALVLSLYSGLIVEMWSVLEPFVQHTRADRQLENYALDFQRLAAEAAIFRTRLYPAPKQSDLPISPPDSPDVLTAS